MSARAQATKVAAEGHRPVLLAEAIEILAPRDGALYVDATFGAGGYSRALLEAARCRVLSLDRDPTALTAGARLAGHFPDRLELILGRFGEMERHLAARGISAVQGITFDFGVSSMQLDEPARGFSFRAEGPLDMRMEGAAGGASAADLANSLTEAELTRLIAELGEERKARRVARAIVAARREAPIETTLQLAEIVRRAVTGGRKGKPGEIDPATRTFQALRIAVNDELGEIDRGLSAAERLLAPGGRLAVVSFHSLEDRRVKRFLAERSGATGGSRHRPAAANPAPSFTIVTRRAIKAGPTEVAANPRARSARLRGAERTPAPAWPAAA